MFLLNFLRLKGKMYNKDIQEVSSKSSFLFNSAIPDCSEAVYRIYPFRINSDCLTSEWYRDHNRAGTSAHCKECSC